MHPTSQAEHPCQQCGAPLPAIFGVETVPCAYCKFSQRNPRWFWVGQEVIAPGFHGHQLGNVVRIGENEITVRMPDERGAEKAFSPHALGRITAEPAAMVPGQRVYVRRMLSWELGTLMRADPLGPFVVARDGWEAPIFHERVASHAVRAALPLVVPMGTRARPLASRFSFGQRVAIIVIASFVIPIGLVLFMIILGLLLR